MRADGLGGGDHVFARWPGAGVADVLHDRAGEEIIHLQNQAHLLVQRFAGDVADVVAVDQHAALLRLIEAGDQGDDAALAAAGGADQGDHLAGLGFEVDVVQDGPLGVVAEGDVLEFARFRHARQGLGVGQVLAPPASGPAGRRCVRRRPWPS